MLVGSLLTINAQPGAAAAGTPAEAQGNEGAQEEDDDEDDDSAEDEQEAIDNALENLNSFQDWLEERRGEYNTLTNFNPNSCAPDFGASPGAMMPSTCGTDGGCNDCYRDAVGELNFIRRQLGRLSCIYANTVRFNEAAKSFGDNVSGVHAINGLAWQRAKAEIEAGLASFKQTYDRKYTDMMGALERALQNIGRCESQYGLPDWYQRFGFMYFEFMKDKYKRDN